MCNFRIKCNERITLVFCLGLIVAFLLTGCATQGKNGKTGAADVDPSSSVTITSIGLSEAADTASVVITSTAPLTYTSVKQPLPLGVVLYFPNTRIDVSNDSVQAAGDPVTAIHAGSVASANDTARIEILLAEDAPYNVVQDADALKIQFAKSIPVKEAEGSGPATASASAPEAAILATPVQSSAPAAPFTSQITPSGTYQGTGVEVNKEDQIWVNRIDFLGEQDGKSTLSIETTKKVDYKIQKVTDTLLELRLMNTNIAEFRQRPLITTRFESAVNRIMPVQLPSMKNYSMFSIELREPVSYYVEQVEELLLVHFGASSVPPAPADETNLPEWKKALQETLGPADVFMAESPKGQAATVGQTGSSMEKEMDLPLDVNAAESIMDADQAMVIKKKTKKFTGEKIALDFFQTDVKNVFRILREVSGKNFAIDKDVSGKVTLTLEKPVPWDQVMDLVLRMNQLGMVAEGDIYRIATLTTLKQENELRKAQIAALQKEKEQLKALEPLETRYIPISYSNATSEILPHIQKIVTPGRGSATVDEKNNQIIITDTIDKIRQAQEITAQIDKVTAQVIIEARVVEVEESYTKELGFNWELGVGPITMFNHGSEYEGNVAMNYAASSDNGFGLSYTKIAGTPLTLDARLTALETNGKARVLSAPKIVTLNNKKAKIKQGSEVGYLERDSAGGSSVSFKDVDLLLEVTPHVTPDNRISLSINITKNDVTNYVEGVPVISTNEANTELLVNDGDTVVIGGIIKSSQGSEKSAFPGLHKIPVLGWMFQSNLDQYESLELLIFMNPKIVQLEQRHASYMDQ